MSSKAIGLKSCKVDKTDELIIGILYQDAKVSTADIARQVKLDAKEVDKRISRLEKEGVIMGYMAHINWQKIRQNHVSALIEVKVTPERNVGFDAVAEAIYKYPEVSSLSLLSGGYDLLVQIEGENLRDVALFVAEKLATIKGVQSTVSHFLLKTYKENNVTLVESSDKNRLPVAP
jgi:DNA-binding Lrp family transcriptional regulator